MKIKIYWYVLTDSHGHQRSDVVAEPTNSICVGGYDVLNRYQQFDSSESYYVHEFAAKHGFTVQNGEMDIVLPVKG